MSKNIHIDLDKYYKNDNKSDHYQVSFRNNDKELSFLIPYDIIEKLMKYIDTSEKEVYKDLNEF